MAPASRDCRERAARQPAAPPQRRRRRARLARDDLRKLHAVLHELAECRKLIEAAVARAE